MCDTYSDYHKNLTKNSKSRGTGAVLLISGH